MRRAFVKCVTIATLACVATVFSLKTASAALLYNPIVTVVGDGVTTGTAGATVTIDLFNNSVAAQVSPVSTVSYNSGSTGTRLVDAYSATTEGSLANNGALSDAAALGQSYVGTGYAYSAGYDAQTGTATVATTANRVVGNVTVTAGSLSNATVLASSPLATQYAGTSPSLRAAVGSDNTSNPAAVYTAGTSGTSTSCGFRNFTTNTQLGSSVTNTRTVQLLGGHLFGSSDSGAYVGISVIDPVALTETMVVTTGASSSTASPAAFALFDDPTVGTATTYGYNVAYIADRGDQTEANYGGIQKWTYNGTSWTLAYTLKDSIIGSADKGYQGLAGEMDATTGKITLFATDLNATVLQQVTDTGAGSAFTTLATAGADYAFRGVALAPAATQIPEPGTLALLGIGALLGLVAFARRRLRRA